MSAPIGGAGPCAATYFRELPDPGEPAILSAGSPRYPPSWTAPPAESAELPALVTVVSHHPPHSLVLTPRGTLVWTHSSCLRCIV